MYSVLRKTRTGESGGHIGQLAGVTDVELTNRKTVGLQDPILCTDQYVSVIYNTWSRSSREAEEESNNAIHVLRTPE